MNQRGQISIFFSASIVVLISIIAFVINVGLFVKAKINLQNATDAAAFSGAAVQARQMTKLGYLNWEMRNIFKEWMYKYYVVGNLNIDDVRNPSGNGNMSFRLLDDEDAIYTNEIFKDPYNIPAVCIHLAGHQTNICRRFGMPGLPEFGNYNLTGAEEASRAFQDLLINTKVSDCVDRSRLNMLTNVAWAYNVISNPGANTMASQGLAVITDKQGAWPKAVELAIRMRNLEYVVNREPESGGVCFASPTHAGIRCGKRINEIESESKLGNERIVKAFYAGYRNLGNERDSEMKNSFTLTELPPNRTPVSRDGLGGANSASYLLIPSTNLGINYHKHYLDLKLMTVNYATFYAALLPRGDRRRSGACDVSKVAIPVPGYPLGYYKNPDVITYYAVKGEAEFVGMFNPFTSDSIKLTAFGAAKPFGGRIGPMLFVQQTGQSYLTGRQDPQKRRSVPYISTLDLKGALYRELDNWIPQSLQLGEFRPGVPLPINSGSAPGFFWLEKPSNPLGGIISGGDIQFGIPNLVYDYQTPFQITGYQHRDDLIHKIEPGNGDQGKAADKPVGLYSRFQFRKFKGEDLVGEVSYNDLERAIYRAKAPTLYEAANYLIPFPAKEFEGNSNNVLDSFGFVPGNPTKTFNGVKVYESMVYAPLYKQGDQVDLLYQTKNEVIGAIFELMKAQQQGMQKYLSSLNIAAKSLYEQAAKIPPAAAGTAQSYRQAARRISDVDNFEVPLETLLTKRPMSCSSMAGQFLHFYYGYPALRNNLVPDQDPSCPQTLGAQLEAYFSSSAGAFDPDYYKFELSWKDDIPEQIPFTAYMPGPFNGVDQDGTFKNIISGSLITETMRRNFYSTKFVPLSSLVGGPGFKEDATNFSIISEGTTNIRVFDTHQGSFKNSLDAQAVNLDTNSIKH
jgi:hypothetical protein